MKCPLCGLEFEESEGLAACKSCPVSRTCGLVKCPNCGYEVPGDPQVVKLIKKWRKNKNET